MACAVPSDTSCDGEDKNIENNDIKVDKIDEITAVEELPPQDIPEFNIAAKESDENKISEAIAPEGVLNKTTEKTSFKSKLRAPLREQSIDEELPIDIGDVNGNSTTG